MSCLVFHADAQSCQADPIESPPTEAATHRPHLRHQGGSEETNSFFLAAPD